jgi:hypothetical protein
VRHKDVTRDWDASDDEEQLKLQGGIKWLGITRWTLADRLTFERILLERAALTGLPLDDKVLTYINWLLESLLPAFYNERPSRSDLAALYQRAAAVMTITIGR